MPVNNSKLALLLPNEMDEWDKFVLSLNQGTIFHTNRWKSLFCKSPDVLAFKENNKIVGGFSYVTNKRSNSLQILHTPLTPYNDPIFFLTIIH